MNLIFFFSAHSSNIPFMDSKKKKLQQSAEATPEFRTKSSELSFPGGREGGRD